MEKYEIPLTCLEFTAEDPGDIHLLETENDRVMILKVGKMSFDYSHIKPDVKFNGVCLRFTELEPTPEGKTQGICFYTDQTEALNRLISGLIMARAQLVNSKKHN